MNRVEEIRKEIEDEISCLKTERKKLFWELVDVHEVQPRIAAIGCAKHTTKIKVLRWVLNKMSHEQS